MSHGMFGEYLELFASTEIFIFVFMEIITKIDFLKPVFLQEAKLKNFIAFTVVFGIFSIFGTYIGTMQSSGAITNIRDLAPIVAGLVGGPIVGVAVGLIGGIHRLFLGGPTFISCSLATILAGLLAGLIHRYKKGKLIGIIPAMLFGASIELMHGALALLIVRPFSEALDIVLANIPQMIIAISLGVGISVILIQSAKETAHNREKNELKITVPQNTSKSNGKLGFLLNQLFQFDLIKRNVKFRVQTKHK